MSIKKIIKKIGRSFIALRQENGRLTGQSILIVDNGYNWLGHLESAIKKIRDCFPKAEISVLTFEERKSFLQKDFPNLNYFFPSKRLRPKKYQIALQMLNLRKYGYDFIILFTFDITPLTAALIFLKCKVVLYNQWGQWWSLRLRNVSEIFKYTYAKKRTRFSFKHLLKRIGLFYVFLQREDEEALEHSILVVDNGHALYEQIGFAMQQIKEALPRAKISVLALEGREDLRYNFTDIKFIHPDEYIIKKYRIARHMLRLIKNKYDYIVLLSLDITPIIVSILFMNSKVLLHNQWHQWWSLKPRTLKGYFMVIPRFILNIIIFVYLVISVSLIFLRRSFNVFKFSILGKKV